MSGNIRRSPDEIGRFRTRHNYIGKTKGKNEITFIPLKHEDVPVLMEKGIISTDVEKYL